MRCRSIIIDGPWITGLPLFFLATAVPALVAAQPGGSVKAAAHGLDYPAKPVRLVVGQTPGGATDIVARAIAQKLGESLGQSVIVDNRSGAAGSIGAALVAKSPPDGYTLLVVSSSFSINPGLYSDLPFDPVKDLAPVTLIAEAPFLLVVNPSLPAKGVNELIALAKARPGALTFSSGGNGSSGHLAGEFFKNLAGVALIHVPYKGAAPATVDVIAGQIDMTFASVVSALPHVKAGKLRALGVTGARRSPAVPQVPTIAEAGVKGYRTMTWYGMLAPAGTASAIIGKLNTETLRALQLPDLKERMSGEGAEPIGSTPAQFASYLDAEIRKWTKVIKDSGVRGD
jgi:tripartite-type tricarboxylate transporter receptor subunit TctC